jgi:tRNA A-37 threonylcarbamoyl transferase component Bud32/SAM-dependent methyltransferase
VIGRKLALSPSERVGFWVRLARFALSVGVPSAPLWILYAVVWVVTAARIPGAATRTVISGVFMGVCGFALTPVAALGIRYFHYRLRLGATRYALSALWALGVAAIWSYALHWILGLAGVPAVSGAVYLLSRAWVSVALAALIFYISYAVRRLLSPRIWPGRRSAGGTAAFRAYPKALSVLDPYDVLGLLATYDGLKEEQRDSGGQVLGLLEQHLLISSDPRFYLPMPLSIAVGFLKREMETRGRAGLWWGTLRVPKLDSFPAQMVVEPAVLHAAGVFAAEYVQYHAQGDIALELRYREAPKPCIEIVANSQGGDLWFVVEENSAAQQAKSLLIDTLQRFASRGVQFDSGQDAGGNLVFRVYVRLNDLSAPEWGDIEGRLGPEAQLLATCALSEGSNRVYASGKRIHKVQLLDRLSPKPLTLAEEWQILKRLEGVRGVPQAASYTEHANFAILSYDRIEGTPIAEFLAENDFGRRAWFRCLSELSSLLNRIHKRGVIHRDLRPDNVLVRTDGTIGLIDFDQAVAGAQDTEQVDIRGAKRGVVPPCISLPEFIEALGLTSEYDEVMEQLHRAWRIASRSDASSPGRNLAYYDWLFGHTELPGERDWFSRWDLIYTGLQGTLRGARVLDLGCNLGLVATHCMLCGAQRVTAVDVYEDILDAARMVADAAGVEVDFVKGDLNSSDFVERLLGQEYDVILALSVTHWIKNRDQAARILAAAPILIFEGHSPASEEADNLRELGFAAVELLGYSERLRAMFRASRGAG